MAKFALLLAALVTAVSADGIGRFSMVNGEVFVGRGAQKITASVGMEVDKGDRVATGDKSRAQLIFTDDTVITLGKKTDFSIDNYLYDESASRAQQEYSVVTGGFRVMTGAISRIAPDKFRLNTSTSTIGIRGTLFVGVTGIDADKVACLSGMITLTSRLNSSSAEVAEGRVAIAPIDGDVTVLALNPDTLQSIETEGGLGGGVEAEEAEDGFNDAPPPEAAGENTEAIDDSESLAVAAAEEETATRYSPERSITINHAPTHLTYPFPTPSSVNPPTPPNVLLDDDAFILRIRIGAGEAAAVIPGASLSGDIVGYALDVGSASTAAFYLLDSDYGVEWGYWKDADELRPYHVWAAGNPTPEARIQELIDSRTTETYDYSGKVIGSVGSDPILMNNSNEITIAINFDDQTIAGRIKFQTTENPTSWDVRLAGPTSNITGNSYSVNIDTSNSSNAITGGSTTNNSPTGGLNGHFYGSNASATAGQFYIDGGSEYGIATGVFKASRR